MSTVITWFPPKAPKERPINFKAWEVRAILAGTKTQTRRIVKNAEYYGCPTGDCPHSTQWECYQAMNGADVLKDCPFGSPGERLWVRETWGYKSFEDAKQRRVTYRVDSDGTRQHKTLRWRPSIHMPRWASRITLEIVSVRVERLHSISFADCRAEGCDPDYSEQVEPCKRCDMNDPCTGRHTGEKWHFSRLWDSIHGPGAWDINPWVWVVEFRRIER